MYHYVIKDSTLYLNQEKIHIIAEEETTYNPEKKLSEQNAGIFKSIKLYNTYACIVTIF